MKNIFILVFMAVMTGLFAQNQELVLENGKYFNVNGTLFCGQYIQVENGLKIAELTVEDGVRSGPAMYFYADGQAKEVGQFENGKRSGQ